MTRSRRLLGAVLVLALLTLPTTQAGFDEDSAIAPDSVLFVGNSFTFYNNAVYTHLRGLLVAEDPSLRRAIFLKSMTISGGVLADHEGGLMQMLDLRPWDVVVLQGHSLGAIEAERRVGFENALARFSAAIRSRGAQPVLFMTWAYSDRPDMTPLLDEAFGELGAMLDAPVIPVGLAFAEALDNIPGLVLHDPDRLHPSLEGTYLAACVFYAALYGKSPERLDYDASLDGAVALKLRRTAWHTVTDYYKER